MDKQYKRIESKADMEDWLSVELKRFRNDGKYRMMNWLGLGDNAILRRHQILLRKTEYHLNTGHRIRGKLYNLRLFQYQLKWGMHIPPNTCGRGLTVMHVGEIDVNDRARAGENFTIHVHTSLAAGGFSDGVPKLGDGVLMFMGSIVCGDIEIADNVVVGANSVVSKSVTQANVTVSGNPAQIVSDRGRLDMKW